MEATTDELVTIIGEQTIALRILRAELQGAQETIAKLLTAKTEVAHTGGGE